MKALTLIAISLILFASCTEEKEDRHPEMKWTKENSTDLSKNLALQEEVAIKVYLAGHGEWNMVQTGSGLRYFIYENGGGDSIYSGDVAEIEYVISLLDGTECYKTESDEYEEIIIDQSEAESGTQEGLKKMRVGDRAKFIIPSHIGHGLIGDRNKIPPLTTLLIDIHILGKKNE